jgi:hypothetical protein
MVLGRGRGVVEQVGDGVTTVAVAITWCSRQGPCNVATRAGTGRSCQ